ncbi:EthD family reductase [Exilibacterium tricleocarpae]|uniref:EthD family reductase n=2 Tax=Exilibacterium tricleocarpae TaxID=2591008 RepID=A0A545U8H4_9GAMM|nr:EthD family reductase [Exilibacterium tricleocarpae]
MVRITTLYQNTEGAHFDFDYYVDTHLELIRQRMEGAGLVGMEVIKGMSNPDGSPAEHLCIFHIYFTTLEAGLRGIEQHGEEFAADIVNYTNIEPQVQIGAVVHRYTAS